ncbi:tyrosine-type recombinase/integrase [Thiothrix subterranea]|uniref:Site-specific integrase n=2 Tax=Thiothrix subterranea TaxID=2735563 RepID=A0AA51MK40_9GAMM|nr:site-specific integrase [Thiothrix subterranea]MDQ5770666.1 site-specific integrase [Thiothrix subterranea]WML85969.1 site-specific integrase [Thiothrix subterranea]
MAFTIKLLDSLTPQAKPYRKFEGKQRAGFGVQVSSGGKITFIFLYREPIANKQRVMTLGGYYGVDRDGQAKNGGLSLKEAYAAYADAKRIHEEGRDPQIIRDEKLVQENAARRAELERLRRESSMGSIQQLLNAYVADMKLQGKRSWFDVEQCLSSNVYAAIPATTKAKDVLPTDIRAVLAAIIKREKMTMANKVRAYLSAAFAFGIEWDNDAKRHFEALRFGISTNPVRDVPKPDKRTHARDRALSGEEVKHLWDLLDDCGLHPKTAVAIRLLFALGGQRVEEILGLHADDVDMQNQYVTLLDTKNGSTHVVPFGEVAIPLLQERLCDTSTSGALFGKIKGNASEDMGYHTLSRAINRICKRTGMNPFVPKDIRRTVKTLMGEAGIRKEDRDRFQNHALSDISAKHYDRYSYLAEKRRTSAVWDAYLQNILAGSPQANVVQLRVVGA